MSDAMQVAQQRRNGYQKSIAQKETEIAELKEYIEDLDNFLEFGQSLLGKAPAAEVRQVSRPVVQETKPEAVVKSEAAKDDEWGSDDPKAGISRVLASRVG